MKCWANTLLMFVLVIVLFFPACCVSEDSAMPSLENLFCIKEHKCFFIPYDNDMAGKSVGIFTVLKDDTFLIGESGNTCYRVNCEGVILNRFTLIHPDQNDMSVQILAGGGEGDQYVFASCDYANSTCIIDVAAPDGSIHHSETISVGLKYASPIEEGLLLCGYQEVQSEKANQSQLSPWAAKVDYSGKIVWEYTEISSPENNGTGYNQIAELGYSDVNDTYLVCREYGAELQWYILRLDENGDLVDKKLLSLESYMSNGSIEVHDVIAKDNILLLEVSAFENQMSTGSTSCLIAIKEAEVLWEYRSPKNSRIVWFSENGNDIVSIKTDENENCAEFNLIGFSSEDQNAFELPLAYAERTQDSGFEIWIPKLIRSEDGKIWGAGVLTSYSPSDMHSYLFMTCFDLKGIS